MSYLLMPLFIMVALSQYGWVTKRRWMVILFGSIPAAILTYYFVGSGAASAMGHKHFYSLPFGGKAKLSDSTVLGSLTFWWVGWLYIMAWVSRSLKRRKH